MFSLRLFIIEHEELFKRSGRVVRACTDDGQVADASSRSDGQTCILIADSVIYRLSIQQVVARRRKWVIPTWCTCFWKPKPKVN